MQWRDDTTLPSGGLCLRSIGKSSECFRMTAWVRSGKALSTCFPVCPRKANVGMGQTRSGRSARLSTKVLAIPAHTIFKLEQTAGAAVNDALLRQIVDNLRRHPKTARQSVG